MTNIQKYIALAKELSEKKVAIKKACRRVFSSDSLDDYQSFNHKVKSVDSNIENKWFSFCDCDTAELNSMVNLLHKYMIISDKKEESLSELINKIKTIQC